MQVSPSAVVSNFAHDIPVDLNAMAAELGIGVHYDMRLPKEVSGKISRDRHTPSGYVISINAKDPHRRKRFTLAHEIAHYVLHRDLIGNLVDDAMYRSELSSQYERQANIYAAKLLLPADAVQRVYRQNPNITVLAERFDVSEKAMEIRLDELGLPLRRDEISLAT